MEVTTLSIENLHMHGALYADVLKAKECFAGSIAAKSSSTTDFLAGDQYDTPASKWIALHENGRVLGGVRLTPTIHKCGVYTYQIRDAQNGILEAVEDDPLYGPAPVDANIWEAGPIFVGETTPVAERHQILRRLAQEMVSYANETQVHSILALAPETWKPIIERFGCTVTFVGPTISVDGAPHRAISINFNQRLH